MKVLFIAHDSLKTGSGSCLFEFLSLISEKDGISPVVLCHNNNLLYDALKKKGIETYFCRFGYAYTQKTNIFRFFFRGKIYRHLANLWAYIYLRLKINLNAIDVIYSNSGIIDFGAYLHRRIKKPLIWHLRELEKLEYVPVMSNFADYVNCNANKVITVSNALKEHFVKIGVDERKIRCIYDGVVASKFGRFQKKNDDSRLKICIVGRFSIAKGQLVAIDALKQLSKSYLSRIQLDFYGNGALEHQLRKQIDDYNLADYICFKGFCSNLGEIIYEYDVGLNLSKVEGFGRTTVEYMLEGLYVIALNGGATPEILGYGKYGSLVNDSTELAKVIMNVVDDRNHYYKIAQEGQRYALQLFDIEKNYKNIVSAIKNVVE